METSAVAVGAVGTTRQTTSRGIGDLSSEDFFGLLIAQLKSQDPLNPMDNQQFLEQMSSIRQMEQSTTLNATLKALASEQRFGATTGLIGHYVSGTVTDRAGNAYEVRGIVIGVRYQNDGHAVLELHDGRSLPADAVDQVTLVENLPQELLEQLQAEAEATDGVVAGSADAAGTKDDAAARRLPADGGAVRASDTGDWVRQFAHRADSATTLLEALLAPGVSVGT